MPQQFWIQRKLLNSRSLAQMSPLYHENWPLAIWLLATNCDVGCFHVSLSWQWGMLHRSQMSFGLEKECHRVERLIATLAIYSSNLGLYWCSVLPHPPWLAAISTTKDQPVLWYQLICCSFEIQILQTLLNFFIPEQMQSSGAIQLQHLLSAAKHMGRH